MSAYTDFLALNAEEPPVSDRPRWLRWYPRFVEARLAALEEIARELELDIELKDQIADAKIEAAVNGIPEDEHREFDESMVHPDDPCQSKGYV